MPRKTPDTKISSTLPSRRRCRRPPPLLFLQQLGDLGITFTAVKTKQSNTNRSNNHRPMFTLRNYGRSGTGLFHSLLDGHPEISTLPSIYFSEFFNLSNLQELLSNGTKGICDKLYEKYPVFFDSRRPEPINSIGQSSIYNLGIQEGLTQLGDNRDEHLEMDKEKFRYYFTAFLEKSREIDLSTM